MTMTSLCHSEAPRPGQYRSTEGSRQVVGYTKLDLAVDVLGLNSETTGIRDVENPKISNGLAVYISGGSIAKCRRTTRFTRAGTWKRR